MKQYTAWATASKGSNVFKKFRFPISLQISIFLIIVAFIPIAAMLVLKTYENQLLSLTESSNVQQARLCAASLSAIDDTEVSQEAAQNILRNMKGRFDARIRILDTRGALIADSSNPDFVPQVDEQEQGETYVTQNTVQADESFIYRLFSIPVRIYRKLRPPTASYSTADYYSGKHIYDGTEIKAALDGRYGSATRISSGGQVSVTLYSAVPVMGRDGVTGVVLVSRSTYRILQNLYELRVDIGKVFLWSLLAVALIATFLALRISRPLKKLSKQTVRCADKNGHIVSTEFTGIKRHDEVGDLSRSFTQLIKKLNARIRYTEAFSADVSHEFKNPLAAIRSSAELLQDTSISQQEHKQFTDAILDEVTHLQSLLTGVRRISRIDGGIEQELQEEIDVQTFIQNVSARVQKAYPQTCITTELSQTKTAKLNGELFDRLLSNLLENAASFATQVYVSANIETKKQTKLFLTVSDNGPGISESESKKIFNRFYSTRTNSEESSHAHTGLGLSIVKAIVDAYEGTITVSRDAQLGGAKFEVMLSLK